MKSIVRYCLILVFLCGTFTSKGQDPLKFADSLFSAGDFIGAGLAYEWALYSGTEGEAEAGAKLGRARAFKNQGLFGEAGTTLDRINLYDLPDKFMAPVIYETILVNYLAGNYPEVQSRFLLGKKFLEDSDYEKGAKLVLCLSQLHSGQWDLFTVSAESFIKKASPENADSLISGLYEIFDTIRAPKEINPRKARIMSMIIPGSGQVYAGSFKEGAISFGLHAIALGGAGIAFLNGFYITGWIGGFGLLQKLYFGGVMRAEDMAREKNRLNKQLFAQPVSGYLIAIDGSQY